MRTTFSFKSYLMQREMNANWKQKRSPTQISSFDICVVCWLNTFVFRLEFWCVKWFYYFYISTFLLISRNELWKVYSRWGAGTFCLLYLLVLAFAGVELFLFHLFFAFIRIRLAMQFARGIWSEKIMLQFSLLILCIQWARSQHF